MHFVMCSRQGKKMRHEPGNMQYLCEKPRVLSLSRMRTSAGVPHPHLRGPAMSQDRQRPVSASFVL